MPQHPATTVPVRVACIVDDLVSPFEIGVASEVFGDDRTDRGVPAFDFRLVAPTPGRIAVDSAGGFALLVDHDLTFADEADVVIVPAFRDCAQDSCGAAVLDAIRRAHARGAWVLTLCTGAFVAARAGLLDGGRATTHWKHADRMQVEFPAIDVACDALYVQHDRVITSAGTAGAIDAALHLVTLIAGAQAAATIARAMVMPPQRDGGQSQYATGPVVERHAETLAPLVEWMAGHLDAEHSVASLAARAHMSERTFARRFKDELGTTPAAWLARHRVRRAQQLLEATDLTLDAVASEAGFGTAALMRHHFQQQLSTTPSAYRQRFQVARAAFEPAA